LDEYLSGAKSLWQRKFLYFAESGWRVTSALDIGVMFEPRRGNVEDTAPMLEDLVTANRILAHEGVLDSFGHVSVRRPRMPDCFLLSRARA
jgi:hypothetical protein